MGPLSAITRYKLRKLLKYALVTAGMGSMFMLFGGQASWLVLVGWALLGVWTGVLEEFLFGRRFRSLAVPLQLLGKAVAVNLFTVAVLTLAWLASEDWSPLFSRVHLPMAAFVQQTGIYRFAAQVVGITSVAILVVQVEEFLGRRFFLGFVLGWYDQPRYSERVVLSIDLKGSSSLNERLGDMLYFRFLNTTLSLMTDSVLRHDAEILKYIGDEVIFTWPMRSGTQDYNCLGLFFDIQARISAEHEQLMREFGVVPHFRGGLHGGNVITARVGHVKRAIDFSGDVMNQASRLQAMAKSLEVDLVVSEDMLERMPRVEERFILGDPVTMRTKGSKRQIKVRPVAIRETVGTGKG